MSVTSDTDGEESQVRQLVPDDYNEDEEVDFRRVISPISSKHANPTDTAAKPGTSRIRTASRKRPYEEDASEVTSSVVDRETEQQVWEVWKVLQDGPPRFYRNSGIWTKEELVNYINELLAPWQKKIGQDGADFFVVTIKKLQLPACHRRWRSRLLQISVLDTTTRRFPAECFLHLTHDVNQALSLGISLNQDLVITGGFFDFGNRILHVYPPTSDFPSSTAVEIFQFFSSLPEMQSDQSEFLRLPYLSLTQNRGGLVKMSNRRFQIPHQELQRLCHEPVETTWRVIGSHYSNSTTHKHKSLSETEQRGTKRERDEPCLLQHCKRPRPAAADCSDAPSFSGTVKAVKPSPSLPNGDAVRQTVNGQIPREPSQLTQAAVALHNKDQDNLFKVYSRQTGKRRRRLREQNGSV